MAPVRHGPGNLPSELTSFVGRRAELAEVRRLLAGSRLVTPAAGVSGLLEPCPWPAGPLTG